MSGQDFFKKVFSNEEKDRIIQDFVHSGLDLYTKITEQQHLALKPSLLKKTSFLCRFPDGTAPLTKLKIPPTAVHNFIVHGDRYYFKGNIVQEGNQFEIFFNEDLFQLQRRQSYRFNIPEHLLGKIEISKIDGQQISLRGRLMDLSLGGCSFEAASSSEFKLNQEIELSITIKGKLLLQAKTRVRRSKLNDTPQGTVSFAGVEFLDSTPASEQKIFNLTLDIHRETYGRLV